MNDERDPQRASAAGSPRLAWLVSPWLQPFWYGYLAFAWWQVGVGEASHAGTASAATAAALVPAGKLAGALSEAGFYRLWWRGRGLPYWRFFCVVASASLADVFSANLLGRARATTAAARAIAAALAGPVALGGSWFASPGPRLVLGGLGLLTAVRIAITANAQAKGAGVRRPVALGWTVLVWTLGRLGTWWIADLARGRSPLPVR